MIKKLSKPNLTVHWSEFTLNCNEIRALMRFLFGPRRVSQKLKLYWGQFRHIWADKSDNKLEWIIWYALQEIALTKAFSAKSACLLYHCHIYVNVTGIIWRKSTPKDGRNLRLFLRFNIRVEGSFSVVINLSFMRQISFNVYMLGFFS